MNTEKFIEIVHESKKELVSLGLKIGEVARIYFFESDKKGEIAGCEGEGEFTLVFNEKFLKMKEDDYRLRSTVYHELIHTVPKCHTHGKTFKAFSRKVHEETGINPMIHVQDFWKTKDFKIEIVCECGCSFFLSEEQEDDLKKYRFLCGYCGKEFKKKEG